LDEVGGEKEGNLSSSNTGLDNEVARLARPDLVSPIMTSPGRCSLKKMCAVAKLVYSSYPDNQQQQFLKTTRSY